MPDAPHFHHTLLVSRPGFAVALGGAALAAAFPKVGLSLLVWVAVVPLLVAVQGCSPRQALRLGILFGIVFRAGSLYWLVYAMTQFGGLSWVLALAAAAVVVAYLALYWGALAVVANRLELTSAAAPFVLASTWVGLEYVQSWLLSGFPWELVGYAAGSSSLMVQVADLAGVYGLGFLALVVNAGLAALLVGGRDGTRPVLLATILVLSAAGYGAYSLAGASDPQAPEAGLTVALVQGNVPQDLKWDPSAKQEVLQRHLRLSEQGARAGAQLVVWPESSWPDAYGIERDVDARALIEHLAESESTSLLVGTVHVYEEDRRYEVTNAAVLFDSNGQWVGRYEKTHLVPFGEYLPLQRWLRFLGPLVQAVGAMRPGDPQQPLLGAASSSVPPFGLAICYEIIFPPAARQAVRRGAQFLVTITNDAWYGTTSAPYQHFSMARLRAVETRRYLIRAANTGISGIIDPWGRVVQQSELEQEIVLTGRIFPRHDISPYVRTGDVFAILCMLLGTLAVLGALFPRWGWLYGRRSREASGC